MRKEITMAVVAVFVGAALYLFTATDGIPSYVTGDVRAVYEWAKSPEGSVLLEQVPCYCGCNTEGHMHARHCFWKDDGTFDSHGTSCAVCFGIAKKARQMHEQGKSACEIRYEIDKFYASLAHLSTDTPMPEGCTAYVPTGNETQLAEGCGNEGSMACGV